MNRLHHRIYSILLLFILIASAAEAAPRRKVLTAEEHNELLEKAQEAIVNYDIEAAQAYLDEYEDALTKNKKLKAHEERVEDISAQIILTRNMLDRVEKIVIIDSMVVPKNDFFHYYKLSPEAGRLSDASILPRGAKVGYPGVVYVPENEIELIWAAPDSVHSYQLMSADKLGDGNFTNPEPLEGNLNEKGNANFPFMMPDGITLYYANSGENSLGGYDIFMTRKDEDGFLQPQNVGMPYNSPYDDYMLAIDEITGAGWWATDRNQIPDSITIYIFIPNETRVNHSPSDPNVVGYAKITRIADTWEPGKDYSPTLKAIASVQPYEQDNNNAGNFQFYIPGKGIYTSIDQFRSIRSREAMEKYLEYQDNVSRLKARLADLRHQYSEGNRDVSTEIVRIENQLLSAPDETARLASEIVNSEK